MTQPERIRLLLAEDNRTDAELEVRELTRAGLAIEHRVVDRREDFIYKLTEFRPEIILSDFSMPKFDGMAALTITREIAPNIPFIFVSGTLGEEYAIGALKNGATDYVLKTNLIRLPAAVERALHQAREHAAKRETERALRESEAGLHRAQKMARLAHVITGSDGSFESWSDTLPQLVGVDPAQMPRSTRKWQDFVHLDDRPAFRATAIQAGAKGARADIVYRLHRADGVSLHIRQTMEPLEGQPDSAGNRRWFNTIQDVTEQKRAHEELSESEARFRSLTELSSDFYWETDAEHRMADIRHGLQHKPVGGGGQRGKRRWETPSTRPDAAGWAVHRATLDSRKPFRDFEIARVGADGVERHLSISGEPVFDESGAFKGYRGVGKDITDRKQAEDRIRRLNRVYAVLSGINALIVRVRDRDELFREACRIAIDHGKFHIAWIGVVNLDLNRLDLAVLDGAKPEFEETLRRRDWLGADGSGNRPAVGRVLIEKKAVFSNDVQTDPQIRYANDHMEQGTRSLAVLPLMVADSVTAVLCLHAREAGFFDDDEKRLLLELAGDISFALDHIEKEAKLDYLAYYDSVTGLANRTLFHERLEQGLAAAGRGQRKLALFILDIERFKTINDTLGRQAGDTLLKQIANRMAGNAPDIAWLARIGADHFAIMAPDFQNGDDLARLTEQRLEKFFGQPFRIGETELRIAAKLGIALFPGDGAEADTLFKNAEAALKKAKASGERYLFYTQAMNERVAEKLSLENKLRQAVEKEEFVLHYQPKVDLETRAIVGVEALIRWQSPELGLVPPMKFIPLMEETGLILPVGSWALKRASLDHRSWVDQGLKAPRVAVNVSPIQLRQRDFVSIVEQAIMEGVAPTGIDLEITESLIMEDVEGNIEKLKSVRGLGVTIAIDDFGTGYSSLGYLAKLPVQTLKIDRSFIITMLENSDTMTLVQTMISLAHSLKLKVVAEGVDAEEQAKMLRLMRCDEMQGYLFSRPIPFDQMTALLSQGAKS